jgi:predicted nucleic acid-binding protein
VIFVDTNVVSETLRLQPDASVLARLQKHDAELALPAVVIGELAFGVEKIRTDQRALRLEAGLNEWRRRFAGRIFAFTEDAALVYGQIMGAASRLGRPMSVQDGMIAAIAKIHNGTLATRNARDFGDAGISIVNPWGSK